MKKILLNFLEIGKIDRGLFRIWILATAFVLFAVISDYDSVDTDNYNEAKSIKCIGVGEYLSTKTEDYKINFKKKYSIPMIGGEIFVETKNNDFIYIKPSDLKEKYSIYLNISYPWGKNHFLSIYNKDDCEKQLNKIKSDYKKHLNPLLKIATIPIWVIIGWFFVKKIFLWVVRGFK